MLSKTTNYTRVLRVRGTILVTVVRILKFLVVFSNGFWAFDGFSRKGSPHFGNLRRRKSKNPGGPGNGFRKRSEHCEMDDLAAFVGFPPFRRSQKPEIQEIHRGLGNGFRKRSGLYKIDKFWAFVGFSSISAVPEAGNPGNPQGPWKWLPEKERTLQNRQLLGFCGVPSISAVPEPEIQEIHRGLGNGFRKRSGLYKIDNFWAFVGFPPFRRSQKPEIQEIHRALEMASGKGADSTKSTTFGLLWGSLHFGGPEAGNPGNPQGPWKWLPEKERTLQNRQLLGFCGVPSISAVPEPEMQEIHRGLGNGFRKRSAFSAVPEAGNPANPPGLLKWLPSISSGLYRTGQLLRFCVGSPPFRRSQKPEIQKSTGALGNGFRKRSGLYKIDNFWAFVGFPPFRLS